MRYRAFISYSREDKRFAKKLHHALERYRAPSGVETGYGDRSLGRFFKDDNELAGAEGLGAALDKAIDNSENLIVIATPNSARSKWVNREVGRFKQRDFKRVLAVIAGGSPNSNDEKIECFSPALRFKLDPDGNITEEPADPPLAPNFAEEGFSRAFTRLVAGILDIPFDRLWRRERRRRLQRLGVLCICAVVFILGLSIYYSTTDQYGVLYTDLGRAAVSKIRPAIESEDGVTFFASLEKEIFWSDLAGHEGYDTSIVIHALDDNGNLSGRLEFTRSGVSFEIGEHKRFGVFGGMSEESVSSILVDFGYVEKKEGDSSSENEIRFTLPMDNDEADRRLTHQFDARRAVQIIGNDHTPPTNTYFTFNAGANWTNSVTLDIHLGNASIWSYGLSDGCILIGTPEEVDPYYPTRGELYITTDYGKRWESVPSVHGDWNSLKTVGGNRTNSSFLAVELGSPLRNENIEQSGLWLTRDGGITWEPAGYQGTENNVSQLFMTNEGDLVAIVNGQLIRYGRRTFLDRVLQRYDVVTTGSSLSGE